MKINKEELARMVELYRTGKITKYALEAELSKAFSAAMEPNIVAVSLVSEQDGNTNSTFGATLFPEKIGEKITVTLLLDKEMVLGLATSSEIVDLVENELKGFQKTIKDFNSFVREKKGTAISISDTVLVFLKIFRESVARFSEGLPNLFSKLKEISTIQSVDSIDSEIRAIETESDDIRFIIERLTISKKFPQVFVLAAERLVKELGEGLENTAKQSIFYRDDAPVMNQFYQQRRALVDGTYTDNKMSKVIAHDYKPETNQ
jgi:hypothetical protein